MDSPRTELPAASESGRRSILSVGHSNHTTEAFLTLLREHGVNVLCDVRSHPASAYAHQFNEPQLRADLEAAGLRYLFLGHQLGGRPLGDDYYDDEGHVRYDKVSESVEFLSGIKRLEREAAERRVAMMCSEEDPAGCHRRLLVARVLETRGVQVLHLRADGRVLTETEIAAEDVERKLGNQRTLFDVVGAAPWRSIRSVLPKRRQPSFSAD
jgi:uncharacterized protein (DUF488 family)